MSYEVRFLQRVPPDVLEEIVAELLRRMGFKDVRCIGGPSDKGVDIEAYLDTPLGVREKYIVQVKRYSSSKVGHRELMYFIAALDATRADKGIFVTTSDFTRSAIDLVEGNENYKRRIILWNGFKLVDLVKEYNVPLPTTIKREEEIRKPKTRIGKQKRIIRVFELDSPLILRHDYREYTLRLSKTLRRRYGVKEKPTIEKVILEYTPVYVVDWKAYYTGRDSRGRRRLRSTQGRALVMHDGGVFLNIERLKTSWIKSEIKKKIRVKRGHVEASRVICGKGIGVTAVKRIIKNRVSMEYKCSRRDVKIIATRELYLGLRWIIEFSLNINSGVLEADLLRDSVELDFQPLSEGILVSEGAKAIESKVKEIPLSSRIISRQEGYITISYETPRFTGEAIVNVYSGSIRDVKTRIKRDAALALARALIPSGDIIGFEEKTKEIIVDLENKEGLHIIHIDIETGENNISSNLLHHDKAIEATIAFLKSRYNMSKIRIIDTNLKEHRLWEIKASSPDGDALVILDARSSEIIEHKVIYSRRRIKKILEEHYPSRNIEEISFDSVRREYYAKLVDDRFVYEVTIDASTGIVEAKQFYLRPELVENKAYEIVNGMGDKPVKTIKRELRGGEWIVTIETPLWIRRIHLDKVKGVVNSTSQELKPEGVEQVFEQFIMKRYKPGSVEVLEIKLSRNRRNSYVVKLRDEVGNVYYAFVDKLAGKVVEWDTLKVAKGLVGWVKRQTTRAKLEAKYR